MSLINSILCSFVVILEFSPCCLIINQQRIDQYVHSISFEMISCIEHWKSLNLTPFGQGKFNLFSVSAATKLFMNKFPHKLCWA